jgi:hypothetical protein
MIDWLHTLPNLGIGILILGFGLTVSTLAPWWVRHRFSLTPSDPLSKGAEESFKLFVSLTLLLLAFCLVRAQGDHRNVEDLVAREATIVYKLDRALANHDTPQAVALRELTRRYAQSVVTDEWPMLARNGRSAGTSKLLTELTRGTRALEGGNTAQTLARTEALGHVTQMNDVREARLTAAGLELPHYYWQALGCAMALLVVFGWFQSPIPKMVAYVGGVTIGVSVLLTMLIATAGLFVGESRVTAEPLVRTLTLLGS